MKKKTADNVFIFLLFKKQNSVLITLIQIKNIIFFLFPLKSWNKELEFSKGGLFIHIFVRLPKKIFKISPHRKLELSRFEAACLLLDMLGPIIDVKLSMFSSAISIFKKHCLTFQEIIDDFKKRVPFEHGLV